ncbi:ATPase, T2SS/T4P/T4SS family [Aurantimonas sp. C2-6-R+9]|uniref:type IV pilus twitching motility protein PilT n=1 Tax=unclassified Aurantimonas TaxID=2638230 RepID=UPI002E197CE0|nr:MULTISPECIES: ATPase, T2SS/T4P/T4SS family [unclassified Aurantimonas]MEC5291927.1 ATPase, T2SS/T4P/T4SS family [Aurantimonas sp. C2-3-R2]MEC5382736.1 ATPase, T2SS/T4P/T4SS family [Aurantimonas sp. C2-6-R+9]MEC5413013.1 ATPase, T2SS/T4P/T4SS family [Aurantimonas sp. C2-4-R8]
MIDLARLDQTPFDPSGSFVPVLIEEPSRFDGDQTALFDTFVVGAALRGASDITIQSETRPRIQINGLQYFGMRRATQSGEVGLILSHLWNGNDAPTILRQGRALDFSFEVRVRRGHRQRFRVNATGIMKHGSDGIEISMRALPETTPTLDSVELENELRPYLLPRSGIIVIAGATGQGKSTTMAAITRAHLESPEAKKIIDLQAPIEFTYSDILNDVEDRASLIGQSEIGEGRNLKTFADGVWSALRRAPAIINVGEARDRETMTAAIEACLTGHVVNTTTHAGSVAEALRRMASVFPTDEREGRAFDLITSLQLCVVQHLIRTEDERGRIAVREYLLFDEEVRDRFVSTPVTTWTETVTQLLTNPPPSVIAKPLWRSAQELVDAGRITRTEAKRFMPCSHQRIAA